MIISLVLYTVGKLRGLYRNLVPPSGDTKVALSTSPGLSGGAHLAPLLEALEPRLLLSVDPNLVLISDSAPDITIDVLSDTEIRVTNNNLSVGYAVDVYKNGVFVPSSSLDENNLLGVGLFSGVFGTKSQLINLPLTDPTDTIRLEAYARILPDIHPRREFSETVALKNMDAAFSGIISNALGVVGVVAEGPRIAAFASDIIKEAGAAATFAGGDIAGGFNKLATWAASKAATAAIVTVAGKAGITISASAGSVIAGIVAVAFTLPTVWDTFTSRLYQSATLLHTGDAAPTFYIVTNGGGVQPGQCYKDWIPTFEIGDEWYFHYNVTNRSSAAVLFNASLEASLYGPAGSLVEQSSGSGSPFHMVWNVPPTYPHYWDLLPYGDPWCQGSVGLESPYMLTSSSLGHAYQGGFYRLETELLGWYGTDVLGTDSHWIKILDGQVPPAPQQIVAEPTGDAITVSWRAPSETYDIAMYVVRRFHDPSRSSVDRAFTLSVPEDILKNQTKFAPYWLDEHVEPNVTYYYEAKVIDWDGLSSGWSPLLGPVMIDVAPPTPDPSTWAAQPFGTGATSIRMEATVATDPSGVEYFFDETSGNPGGNDSGWQSSPIYQDSGLIPESTYTYRVRTRDKSTNQNTGTWSVSRSAKTTSAPDTMPPAPDPSTWAAKPHATSTTSIAMTATVATDPSGVEYFFVETSDSPGGSDSSWQDSPTYEDTGLSPGTRYTYRVRTRDKSPSQNAGNWSVPEAATTDLPAVPGGIGGQKWYDWDGDGFRDGSEPGLDGWTVELLQQVDRDPLDQRNDPAASTSYSTGVSGNSMFQSFTPTVSQLVAVELRLKSGGGFPAEGVNTNVNIRSGSPAGPVLGSSTTFVPSATGMDLVHFAFDTPIAMVQGETYVIEWFPAESSIYTWLGRDDDPYPGGMAFNRNGIAISGVDLNFLTFGPNKEFVLVDTEVTASTDVDGSGTIDPTSERGLYVFSDLIPGTYHVQERAQDGWAQTYPAEVHEVALEPGGQADGINFGNHLPVALGEIRGQKWYDWDGDGFRDGSEPGLDGWTVELLQQVDRDPLDQRNDPAASTSYSTGVSGNSMFQSFTPTVSQLVAVELRLKSGGGFPAEGVNTNVNIRSGSPAGPVLGSSTTFVPSATGMDLVHFAFDTPIAMVPGETYLIEWYPATPIIYGWIGREDDPYPGGSAFFSYGAPDPDKDYNFIMFGPDTELVLAGTQVTASVDVDGSGTIDPTSERGLYVFSDLVPGTYRVQERAQDGWAQTYPAEVHEVALEPGGQADGINFGNRSTVLPIVTLEATEPSASEIGPISGTFTITRTGNTAIPLSVYCAIVGGPGVATNGTDYALVAESVTIPAGQSSWEIEIAPIADEEVEGIEEVVIVLLPDGSYEIGSPDSGIVTIEDSGVLPRITVGTHEFLPNMPNQTVQIHVTGGRPIEGLNFNAQIGDGGPAVGGTAGPVITAVDLETGIFAGNNDGQVDLGSIPQLAMYSITTSSGSVVADGLLATLTIDTTGFDIGEGPWVLALGNTLNGSTDFAGVAASITDGYIELREYSELVGRNTFYNHSVWDGNDAAANASDDTAIAPDKQALLPGETATFANYTSYSRGINGIMVDIDGLAGTPSSGDFLFKVGNDDNPDDWAAAPAPTSVTVRHGKGTGGSDRVTIIWADNDLDGVVDPNEAVAKQWLQVTVLSDDNGGSLGLAGDNVFYFGNSIGDTGNSAIDTKVNATDKLVARNNPHTFLDPAPIDDICDFDRDQKVNATDELIARNNGTTFLTDLELISVPAAAGGAESMMLMSLASEPMVVASSPAQAAQTAFPITQSPVTDASLESDPLGRAMAIRQSLTSADADRSGMCLAGIPDRLAASRRHVGPKTSANALGSDLAVLDDSTPETESMDLLSIKLEPVTMSPDTVPDELSVPVSLSTWSPTLGVKHADINGYYVDGLANDLITDVLADLDALTTILSSR